VIRNNDVPGVIGRIGTILGDAKLNIANFALGRSRVQKESSQPAQALAVVQLDVPEESKPQLEKALAELRKVPAITSARVVELARL